MNSTHLWRRAATVALLLNALGHLHSARAQQHDTLLTLDDALRYARQHSPRLLARRRGVTTERAALAAASAERWPRLTLGVAARISTQPTQTAMGFPLTDLASLPEDQPFRRGHFNAEIRATLPLYTGGRISSAVHLVEAQRDLAELRVRDVERGLDFDITSTYANLVQLDHDIDAALEAVSALTESRRVVAQMLGEAKVAQVDLLKVETRLADVQYTTIEFRNAREIEAGQLNALLGRAVDTPVIVEKTVPRPIAPPPADQVAALARAGNVPTQMAAANLRIAERAAAVARAAQRPTLSVAVNALGQTADPFTAYSGGIMGGVVLSYPFLDLALLHRTHEAESRGAERQADAQQAELDAAQRARAASRQILNADERIRATEISIGSAREVLRIEKEKQRYGRGIIENLLDAQAALLTAQARYYHAQADFSTACAAVRRETGL